MFFSAFPYWVFYRFPLVQAVGRTFPLAAPGNEALVQGGVQHFDLDGHFAVWIPGVLSGLPHLVGLRALKAILRIFWSRGGLKDKGIFLGESFWENLRLGEVIMAGQRLKLSMELLVSRMKSWYK